MGVAERTAMAPTTATSSPGIVKSFPSKRKESKVKVVKKKASKDGADLDVSQSKGVECFLCFVWSMYRVWVLPAAPQCRGRAPSRCGSQRTIPDRRCSKGCGRLRYCH